MNYERTCYEDVGYRPLLYYVIFGANGEQLEVSRERHHVDEFPEGLECTFVQRTQNSEYMSSMIGGSIGEILAEDYPALYEEIKNTDQWAVIQGEVVNDKDLNYMRNAIGFVQAFMETGAVGVLDLQTFSLFSPKEWENNIFSQEFSPYHHVTILVSEDGDKIWLHTRGMRKFGRPDISIERVTEKELDNAIQVINQMIYYGALGAFFDRAVTIHTHTGKTYVFKPKLINDLDNPDFNNSYYRVEWAYCELVEE